MVKDPEPFASSPRSEDSCVAIGAKPQMLIPQTALRILCHKTGGKISRATFYRWLGDGRISSIRLGSRIFIPRSALDQLIQKCFDVD
jgi:excisionase family DNA binding protein